MIDIVYILIFAHERTADKSLADGSFANKSNLFEMLCFQTVNRVLNRRNCQNDKCQNSFAADIEDIIHEAVPNRIHAFRCEFSEEKETGKEGTDKSSDNRNDIADIKAVLLL